MNNKKYKQTVVPNVETPQEWKELKLQHLRTIIFNHIKTNYSGKTIINLDTRLPIIVSVTSARKTAFGEAIYFKKAAAVLILPDLIKYAEYNNWGNPKPTDGPHIISYLNFKCKCGIDGQKENIRLAVQFQKGANTITTSKSTRKNPHLKGAMLNLIRSVGFYNCRRMQEVSRTETIGHRADFRQVIPDS